MLLLATLTVAYVFHAITDFSGSGSSGLHGDAQGFGRRGGPHGQGESNLSPRPGSGPSADAMSANAGAGRARTLLESKNN